MVYLRVTKEKPNKPKTPDIRFDFKKAVEEVLRDHPQLRSNTVFASVADHPTPDSPLKLQGSWHARLRVWLSAAAHPDLKKEIADNKVFERSTAGLLPASILSGSSIKGIVLNPEGEFVRKFGAMNKALAQTLSFDHETGHVLVPAALKVDGDHPFPENAADAFGTLRSIQRFGRHEEIHSFNSQIRALNFLNYWCSTHLTTPTIDQVLLDSQSNDFNGLTPQETVRLAQGYAERHTPRKEDIDETKSTYRRLLGKLDRKTEDYLERLKYLATTCLATPHQFSFYIGARAFQPFLNPEGFEIRGGRIKLPESMRREFSEKILDRAREFGMEELFSSLKQNKADIIKPEQPSISPVPAKPFNFS